MYLQKIAIVVVQAIHLVSLVFVILGWLLPFESAWIAHACFVPILILHWRMNGNRCVLTAIEHQLLGGPPATEGQFIKGVWKKVCGKIPSDRVLCRITYGAMISAMALSLIRLSLRAS